MIKKTATSLMVLGLLAGCAPTVTEWTPSQSPKENKIQRSVIEHVVRYPAHRHEMCAQEKQRLKSFMNQQLSYPDSTHVYMSEFGGQSQKRVDEITKMLRLKGVRHDGITIDDPLDSGGKYTGSGVILMVERFFVIPPSCGDWSQPLGNARGEHEGSNYGCASAVNLGMMVADPRDLMFGKRTGHYDGTRQALGIQMYREDKVKELNYENTSSSNRVGSGGT